MDSWNTDFQQPPGSASPTETNSNYIPTYQLSFEQPTLSQADTASNFVSTPYDFCQHQGVYFDQQFTHCSNRVAECSCPWIPKTHSTLGSSSSPFTTEAYMDKAFAQLHNTFKEEIAKSTEQMQNYIGYEAGGLKVGPGSQIYRAPVKGLPNPACWLMLKEAVRKSPKRRLEMLYPNLERTHCFSVIKTPGKPTVVVLITEDGLTNEIMKKMEMEEVVQGSEKTDREDCEDASDLFSSDFNQYQPAPSSFEESASNCMINRLQCSSVGDLCQYAKAKCDENLPKCGRCSKQDLKCSHPPFISRACVTCRAAKAKCDTKLPRCGRCSNQDLKCSYQLVRKPMACAKCRAAKVKCDGTLPCSYCSKKNVECRYLRR